MDTRDARTIGPKALEERRRNAVRLHQKSMKRVEIAEVVGVHRNTVGKWIAAWQEGEFESLRAKKRGRPAGSGCRLSETDAGTIRQLIVDNTPDRLGLSFALWTRDVVQEFIKKQCAIDISIGTVTTHLERWGFIPGKPIDSPDECPNVAGSDWLEEITKRAKQEGALIHWVDGIKLVSGTIRGQEYGPGGNTSVRENRKSWGKVMIVRAVTNRGKVRFMCVEDCMSETALTEFMERLIQDCGRKVFVILRHLNVRCNQKKLSQWAETHRDRIRLANLPESLPDIDGGKSFDEGPEVGVRKYPEMCYREASLKEARTHGIMKCFADGKSVSDTVCITGESRHVVEDRFREIRGYMRNVADEHTPFLSSEVCVNPEYFRGQPGRKPGRGGRMAWGIIVRNGKVFLQLVRDCSLAQLQTIVTERVGAWTPFPVESIHTYDCVAGRRFEKCELIFRLQSDACLATISEFRKFCRMRLSRCRGLDDDALLMHVRECEFRFNHPELDICSWLLDRMEAGEIRQLPTISWMQDRPAQRWH